MTRREALKSIIGSPLGIVAAAIGMGKTTAPKAAWTTKAVWTTAGATAKTFSVDVSAWLKSPVWGHDNA